MLNLKSFKPFIELIQQAQKHLFLTKFLIFFAFTFYFKKLNKIEQYFYLQFPKLPHPKTHMHTFFHYLMCFFNWVWVLMIYFFLPCSHFTFSRYINIDHNFYPRLIISFPTKNTPMKIVTWGTRCMRLLGVDSKPRLAIFTSILSRENTSKVTLLTLITCNEQKIKDCNSWFLLPPLNTCNLYFHHKTPVHKFLEIF